MQYLDEISGCKWIGIEELLVHIQMYGYTFKLIIFVCDLGYIDCIFGLDAGKVAGFSRCA